MLDDTQSRLLSWHIENFVAPARKSQLAVMPIVQRISLLHVRWQYLRWITVAMFIILRVSCSGAVYSLYSSIQLPHILHQSNICLPPPQDKVDRTKQHYYGKHQHTPVLPR